MVCIDPGGPGAVVDAVQRAIGSGSYPRAQALASVRRVLAVKRATNPPGSPTSLSPAAGATASLAPPLSGLVNDPVPGTDTATFFVRRQGASTWNVVNGAAVRQRTGARASYRVPAGRLLPATAYEWRMRVCNDAGLCSAPSPVLRFTTITPEPSPTPTDTATATVSLVP
jgi:hypothetical protein